MTGDSKLFVIASRSGRMANRLVLFANFLAFAEEKGHRVVNFSFHSYADFFESTRKDVFCQYPPPRGSSLLDLPPVAGFLKKTRLPYQAVRGLTWLNRKLPLASGRVATLKEEEGAEVTWLDSPAVGAACGAARLVLVQGWRFRAPEWVERHAGVVRDYFRPVAAFAEAAARSVQALKREADLVVGVHVRHGDYPTLNGGQFYYPTARYAQWMHELAEQFPGQRVAFLICSDEQRSAEEFPGLAVGFGPGTPVGDMTALSQCDLILGPMSTFSQWSSFYGNKPLFHLMSRDDRVERERFTVSYLAEIP
ncbi:hypothetical protein GMST_39370 [Geomonas silvestris]|uniref:Alpha-1,2-fucosyltransferase n=1 Tax=Geomonas silvestris TaxID=2740184 RepID=A0A6V8MNX8_9BACT|nr:alpha-1,2-fucosyltransferase [Geomonas silvestris]GFO61612.1 hypothetical protein GMST_39370 [Geomonas silvestris]